MIFRRIGVGALVLALLSGQSFAQTFQDTATGQTAPGFIPLIRSGTVNHANSSVYPLWVTLVGSGALPAGAAAAANQTAPQAPTAPATATATKSILTGCVYNSGGVTFTSGQQGAAQCDSAGRFIINVGSSALPTGAAAATNQTAVQAPIAAAAATATKSLLLGGQYDSTQKTLTNGQQAAVSMSPRGAVYVAPGAESFDVNTAKINGVTPLMGNGVTGTGSQRVTVASDNTPFAVKIDQTTPGTTDRVTPPFTRRLTVAVTFTPGSASYTIGQIIGPTGSGQGVLTLAAGIGNSQPLLVERITWVQPFASASAIMSNAIVQLVNASLSGTYTNGAVPPIDATDAPKISGASVVSNNGGTASTTSFVTRIAPLSPAQYMTTDGSGNIRLFFMANGTETWTTPGVGNVIVQIAY